MSMGSQLKGWSVRAFLMIGLHKSKSLEDGQVKQKYETNGVNCRKGQTTLLSPLSITNDKRF